MNPAASPQSVPRWSFQTSRLVRSGPERTWQAFCRLSGWPRNGLPSRFKITLRPLGFKVMVPARILEHHPGRLVNWEARWGGLTSRQAYSFQPEGDGVRVIFSEQIAGWPLLPLRLLFSPGRLSANGRDWLARLADLAESGQP